MYSKSFSPHYKLSKDGSYKQPKLLYWPSPFHSGLSINTDFFLINLKVNAGFFPPVFCCFYRSRCSLLICPISTWCAYTEKWVRRNLMLRKDMRKLWGLFSLVFFSNPGLIFKPGELLNTRSAGLAEPTFPGSRSPTSAVSKGKQ